MTFEQMKMMRAVVEQGGIIAASKVLHKTQPAVSNMINRLESELEIKLFTREGYRVQLTPQGSVIYEQITIMLAQMETVESLAKNYASGNEPQINISIEVLCPQQPISQILKTVREQFPYTNVSITSDTLFGGLEKLDSNEVELAIGPHPSHSLSTESLLVTQMELVPVFASHHCAIKDSLELDQKQLLEHVQIVIPDSSSKPTPQLMLSANGSQRWQVPDFSLKKQLIIEGIGWGYMPLHLVKNEIEKGQLVIAKLSSKPRVTVPIFAMRNSARPHGPVAQLLWQQLGDFGKVMGVETTPSDSH